MKKNILISLIVLGVIALVAGAGVGGFFYGKSYESNRANTIRDNFMRDRGIQGFDPNATSGMGMNPGQDANSATAPTGGNFPAGGMGRGASGEIKSMDGNTLTLTTGQTETKVTLSDTTIIVKTVTGSTADLTTGERVMVTGDRDADGNVTATQVTVLNSSQISSGTTP